MSVPDSGVNREFLAKIVGLIGYLIGTVSLIGSIRAEFAIFMGLLAMPVVVFASIVIHELGHALFGKMTGGTVKSFLVVPFELRFDPFGMSIRTRAQSGDIGGRVIVDYVQERRTKWRVALMVMGGPVSNLVMGAMLLGWAVFSPAYAVPQGIAAGVAWTSIGLGAANLVPLVRNGHRSDGLRLRDLFSSGRLSESPGSPKSPA